MDELTAKREFTSAFDAHHAPPTAIIEKCVHCGFCLPVCPTYVLWGQEMDSPRGRIYLIKIAMRRRRGNECELGKPLRQLPGLHGVHDGVPLGSGLRKTHRGDSRADRTKDGTLPGRKLHRRFVFETFTRPDRLRQMRWPLLAYQKSGLQAVVRGSGLLKLLPKKIQAMEALLPKLEPRETVAEVTPAMGTKRRRVGLLLGCVQREFFPQVNAATARVLAAEGCEVVAPGEQPCCGALLIHAGEEAAAIELAKKTIEAFERASVEIIVTNAAGCGSNVKEYGHLLRDEPEYAERAKVFAAKCKDISEILAELEPRAKRSALKLRVAFHDSCHLQHAQGVRSQPRTLLSKIPGLELAEIPEGRDLLRVRRDLQPGAAGCSERAGRPQGRAYCTLETGRGGDRESGLFDTASSVASTSRLEDSRGAHNSARGCIDTGQIV